MIRPSPRILVLAIAALLVLSGLAAGGWLWYAAGQRRAMGAYAEALTGARAAPASPEARAAAIRSLETVLGQYPSAAATAEGAYQLGNLRYDDRQFAAARAAYEIALAKGPPPTIRALASLAIGRTWEAERNYSKAIEAHQAALARLGPRDFLYEEAFVALGRVQELGGRRDDAIASYRKMLKDLPETRRGDEVRSRLARLGASAP